MILKNPDNKEHIIKVLAKLLRHPKIFPKKKEEIKAEIYRIKKGYENEKLAAYYINSYLKDSERTIVLHDVRLKVDNYLVQIDHLLLHRVYVTVLESKYFSSELYYDKKTDSFFVKTQKGKIGIPNPLKQAERQILELERIIKHLKLDKHLPLNFDYYVLLSPRTIFHGDLPEKVIKADKIYDKLEERAEKFSLTLAFKTIVNMVKIKKEDLIFAAEKLLQYHRPITVKDILKKLKLDWINIEKLK